MIDSGVWPEDASFGDKQAGGVPVAYNVPGTQVYGPPPAKWKGICQAGEGFTSAMCNNKLIGARYYLAGFTAGSAGQATLTSFEYRSPRDGGGHGSHTSSTAGGNEGVPASIDGIAAGNISGMAPRARIATYKVCWEATVSTYTGCYTNDTLKAIDDAIADGVDVINFSVGGTRTNFVDPVEIGFFNATAANIFVAASAGNDGPANTVAHIAPWLTTVAASTHDRFTVATVTLGNGATFSGPSYQTTGVSSMPMILSQDATLTPFAQLSSAEQLAAQRCYDATKADDIALGATARTSLDPAKVAGKMLVCIRGGNVLINKDSAAKAAGASAMIIQNTPATADTQINQPYVLPTVHLAAAASTTVLAYVPTAGSTGAFSGAVQQPGTIAPVMASFSSRGPNIANGNILKPDISAPGVDVIAAFLDSSLTQAQHDAVVAGAFTAAANATSLQGTSMASPHIAGIAALMKQAHPTWSPAAIKSALMTTTNSVKLASGAADPDRWGYGAGHVSPTSASNVGLVYDASPVDYGRFLCGLGLTPPAGVGTCAGLGSILPWNLNLASLTASDVPGTITLTRRVTNVSNATATYTSSASLAGWNVAVNPPSLTLAPGASATFTVSLTRASAAVGAWTFGTLQWVGPTTVTSPLSARAIAFVAPAEISDVRAAGTGNKVFTITSSYSGSLGVAATGLVPATVTNGSVATNTAQCFAFNVPAGAEVARFQLFNADTLGGSNTDLDLEVYRSANCTGTLVGSSGSSTSNEIVTLKSPTPATYSVAVIGFATPAGGATYKLSSWIVGPAAGAQTLIATGPSSVYAGGAASIITRWTVPAGARYLGNVRFIDSTGAVVGSTIMNVDNH